jgi:hypothetical protein
VRLSQVSRSIRGKMSHSVGVAAGLRWPGLQERRDAAVIAVVEATGIRLSELAGIRRDPDDPQNGDVDLWHRDVTIRGKAARPARSRSATTPQASSTGTSASGTLRRTGRSCGSASTTWPAGCLGRPADRIGGSTAVLTMCADCQR